MNFYISDLHLGHKNVIAFDNRPFNNIYDMENIIIKNWNNAVSKDDYVYIIGDFIWYRNENRWKEILEKLNGHKVLIRGNHDLTEMSDSLKAMFHGIYDYHSIEDNGRIVLMCHYPMPFYRTSWNDNYYMICGHVHNTRENEMLNTLKDYMQSTRNNSVTYSRGQIYNVGCMLDYMGYTPRTLDEIINAKSKIKSKGFIYNALSRLNKHKEKTNG